MHHIGYLLLTVLLLPSFAFAARYRIDPQPRNPIATESFVTNPWLAIAVQARSKSLNLLNFVVDESPEMIEGIDYPKYHRSRQFGSWIKANPKQSCYNTRAEILIRDSIATVTFSERNPCLVKSGRWRDLYTGLEFTDASHVQIDHVVPLKNAYVSGAWDWDKKQRCHYANFKAYDSHLLTVDGRENMRKGDRSPARYMPPDVNAACMYLKRWLNIKAVWNLTLAEDEAVAIQELVQHYRCGARFQSTTETAFRALQNKARHISRACR